MILKQTMICKCMLQEAKVFKELVLTDTAKGLVHTFFAQRMTSKVLFLSLLILIPLFLTNSIH